MEKEQAKLIAAATLITAGVVWTVVDHVKAKKKEAERAKRTEQVRKVTDAFIAHLDNINKDLDKRIETAKFWNIVTEEFEG